MIDWPTIITRELDKIVDELKAKHLRLGQQASGKWEKSLYIKISGKTGEIWGQDYTEYLTKGRPPNRNQGEEAIRKWVAWAGSTFLAQWVRDKGLDLNPYAVAWSIATTGTKMFPQGSDLIDGVLTAQRLGKMTDDVGVQIADIIADNLVRDLQIA